MLLWCGALVNGPYALITTAVSADLVSGFLHVLITWTFVKFPQINKDLKPIYQQ